MAKFPLLVLITDDCDPYILHCSIRTIRPAAHRSVAFTSSWKLCSDHMHTRFDTCGRVVVLQKPIKASMELLVHADPLQFTDQGDKSKPKSRQQLGTSADHHALIRRQAESVATECRSSASTWDQWPLICLPSLSVPPEQQFLAASRC